MQLWSIGNLGTEIKQGGITEFYVPKGSLFERKSSEYETNKKPSKSPE